MDRILQGTGATIQTTFTVDGVATDPAPATATLELVREDGTVLLAAGAATVRTAAGVFTYNLTPAQTASLDVLTAKWTATLAGNVTTLRTTVEVVGGFLFTLADARALNPLNNTTTYPTARLIAFRTMAEAALEDACGVAFVPRYAREKLDGNGGTDLFLPDPRPLTLESGTVNGSAIIASDVELYREGLAYYANGWRLGRRNVELKYSHGYAVPPPRVGRGALALCKRFIVDSAISDRATSVITDEGTQFLVTAGVRDAVFDVPEANAVVNEYGYLRSGS